MLLQCLFFSCLGFLLGSVLFSYHLPLWLKGVDTARQSADRNPGTANAMKLAGVPTGLLCLLLDMLKGFLPVFLASRVTPGFFFGPLMIPVLAAPALGHALAPWYPFHGGKAIATAFGTLAGLLPGSLAVFALALWYLFFSLVVVIHPNERRSVVTFACFAASCLLASAWTGHWYLALGCAALACVPIRMNYRDLRRAASAEEDAPEPARTAAR